MVMESEHKLGGQRYPTVVSGPLAGYAAGFRQALIAQGYARRTIGDQMSMMAHLSRWLGAGGLDVQALQSAAEIDRFLAERRAGGHRTRVSRAALSGLLGFLDDHEVIGPVEEPATGPVGRLLAEYRAYLRDERGAAPGTIRGFTACAAMFLQSVAAPGKQPGEALSGLSAADITSFVAGWARSRSPAYNKSMVSALRSLLRFLHVAGYIPRPLDTAVPAVPVRPQQLCRVRRSQPVHQPALPDETRHNYSIGILAQITMSGFMPVAGNGLMPLGGLRAALGDVVGPHRRVRMMRIDKRGTRPDVREPQKLPGH
jgi:integrase/recombinase XerD